MSVQFPGFPIMAFVSDPSTQKKMLSRIARLENSPRVHSPEESSANSIQMTELEDIDKYLTNVISLLSTNCIRKDMCPSNLIGIVIDTIARHYINTMYLAANRSYQKAKIECESFYKEGGRFAVCHEILVEKVATLFERYIEVERRGYNIIGEGSIKPTSPKSN